MTLLRKSHKSPFSGRHVYAICAGAACDGKLRVVLVLLEQSG